MKIPHSQDENEKSCCEGEETKHQSRHKKHHTLKNRKRYSVKQGKRRSYKKKLYQVYPKADGKKESIKLILCQIPADKKNGKYYIKRKHCQRYSTDEVEKSFITGGYANTVFECSKNALQHVKNKAASKIQCHEKSNKVEKYEQATTSQHETSPEIAEDEEKFEREETQNTAVEGPKNNLRHPKIETKIVKSSFPASDTKSYEEPNKFEKHIQATFQHKVFLKSAADNEEERNEVMKRKAEESFEIEETGNKRFKNVFYHLKVQINVLQIMAFESELQSPGTSKKHQKVSASQQQVYPKSIRGKQEEKEGEDGRSKEEGRSGEEENSFKTETNSCTYFECLKNMFLETRGNTLKSITSLSKSQSHEELAKSEVQKLLTSEQAAQHTLFKQKTSDHIQKGKRISVSESKQVLEQQKSELSSKQFKKKILQTWQFENAIKLSTKNCDELNVAPKVCLPILGNQLNTKSNLCPQTSQQQENKINKDKLSITLEQFETFSNTTSMLRDKCRLHALYDFSCVNLITHEIISFEDVKTQEEKNALMSFLKIEDSIDEDRKSFYIFLEHCFCALVCTTDMHIFHHSLQVVCRGGKLFIVKLSLANECDEKLNNYCPRKINQKDGISSDVHAFHVFHIHVSKEKTSLNDIPQAELLTENEKVQTDISLSDTQNSFTEQINNTTQPCNKSPENSTKLRQKRCIIKYICLKPKAFIDLTNDTDEIDKLINVNSMKNTNNANMMDLQIENDQDFFSKSVVDLENGAGEMHESISNIINMESNSTKENMVDVQSSNYQDPISNTVTDLVNNANEMEESIYLDSKCADLMDKLNENSKDPVSGGAVNSVNGTVEIDKSICNKISRENYSENLYATGAQAKLNQDLVSEEAADSINDPEKMEEPIYDTISTDSGADSRHMMDVQVENDQSLVSEVAVNIVNDTYQMNESISNKKYMGNISSCALVMNEKNKGNQDLMSKTVNDFDQMDKLTYDEILDNRPEGFIVDVQNDDISESPLKIPGSIPITEQSENMNLTATFNSDHTYGIQPPGIEKCDTNVSLQLNNDVQLPMLYNSINNCMQIAHLHPDSSSVSTKCNALPLTTINDEIHELSGTYDQLIGKSNQLTGKFDQIKGKSDQLADKSDQLKGKSDDIIYNSDKITAKFDECTLHSDDILVKSNESADKFHEHGGKFSGKCGELPSMSKKELPERICKKKERNNNNNYNKEDDHDNDEDEDVVVLFVDLRDKNDSSNGKSNESPLAETQIRDDSINDNSRSHHDTDLRVNILNSQENVVHMSVDKNPLKLVINEKVNNMEAEALLRKCIQVSCSECSYCKYAQEIAVNITALSDHLLKNHAFETSIHIDDDLYICGNDDLVLKLKISASKINENSISTKLFTDFSGNYECPYCEFSTSIFKDMCVHMKSHAERKHTCELCEYTFTNFNMYLCHLCPGEISSHRTERFHCPICSLSPFTTSTRLHKHLLKEHNI